MLSATQLVRGRAGTQLWQHPTPRPEVLVTKLRSYSLNFFFNFEKTVMNYGQKYSRAPTTDPAVTMDPLCETHRKSILN